MRHLQLILAPGFSHTVPSVECAFDPWQCSLFAFQIHCFQETLSFPTLLSPSQCLLLLFCWSFSPLFYVLTDTSRVKKTPFCAAGYSAFYLTNHVSLVILVISFCSPRWYISQHQEQDDAHVYVLRTWHHVRHIMDGKHMFKPWVHKVGLSHPWDWIMLKPSSQEASLAAVLLTVLSLGVHGGPWSLGSCLTI